MNVKSDDYNFYRIDDLLLRWAVLAAIGVVIMLAAGLLERRWDNPLLYAALLGPCAMLVAGLCVRRREKQTLAIWRTLERNVSTRVADLLANADFSRRDIQRAVRLLNNRGLGFYIWHRDGDVIEDGRLGDDYVHIENCESCGARVGLKVPVSLRTVPRCQYCHAPASGEHLNLLKRDAISRLRGEPAAVQPQPAFLRSQAPEFGVPVQGRRKPMSVWLFVLLLFVFWPGAIAYAVYKANSIAKLR